MTVAEILAIAQGIVWTLKEVKSFFENKGSPLTEEEMAELERALRSRLQQLAVSERDRWNAVIEDIERSLR